MTFPKDQAKDGQEDNRIVKTRRAPILGTVVGLGAGLFLGIVSATLGLTFLFELSPVGIVPILCGLGSPLIGLIMGLSAEADISNGSEPDMTTGARHDSKRGLPNPSVFRMMDFVQTIE